MADNICAGVAVMLIGLVAQETNIIIAILAGVALKFIAIPFYFMILKAAKL